MMRRTSSGSTSSKREGRDTASRAGRLWDLSLPLDENTPTYPGLPKVEVTWLRAWEAGGSCAISKVALCSHVGTHVDAPYHYVPGGRRLGDIPLERLVGPARVVDLSDYRGRALDARTLAEAGLAPGIVLLRTRNSALWASEDLSSDYVYLSRGAAEAIVRSGVTTCGFDFLSVDPLRDPQKPAHNVLLGADVVIFEGLDLSAVPAGEYFFVGLPLRFDGLEGSPARVILIEKAPTA